jgi:hypothetical protein
METQYTWTAKFFSNTLSISKYGEPAGELRRKTWKRISEGELNGTRITFEVKGFFDRDFLIMNPDGGAQIGKIVFNTWRTKATITLNGKDYNWEYENWWHTKWIISNENGNLIKFASGFKSGNILTYTDDNILTLTGLFIRDYLQQRAAASAAAST